MSEPTTAPATVDASALVAADLGDDTRVTPTIGEASGGEAAAGVAAPTATVPGAELDAAGVAFDASKHEGGRKADGTWKLKRGSGARKAKGLPLTLPPAKGATRSRVFIPPAPAAQQPGEAPASTPGAAGAVVDAIDAPAAQLTEADYATTAASLVGTVFAFLAIGLGPAWKLATDERDAWRDAIARLWAHYQLPRVGPLLEVLTLGVVTVEKRADDPETRRRFGRALDWLIPSRVANRPKVADQVEKEAA